MDKRSLLFVACVTASFFCLNVFFSYWNGQTQPSTAIKEQIAEVPLVELFADPLGREKAATALRFNGRALTLAWKETLPSKLYIQEGQTFEALSLASLPKKAGDPVFYEKGTGAVLELPSFPTHSTEMHYLTLGEHPLVSYSSNEIAIAMVKGEFGYLPVGIYEPSLKRVTPLKDFERLQSLVQQSSADLTPPTDQGESFYVLENEYQQLVFSSRGGSLAEINLPLKLSKESRSVVKEIDIDREIVSQSPQNAHFPLHSYYTAEGQQTQGSLGGYYPLLRRPLLNRDGTAKSTIAPQYYALNIRNGNNTLSNLNFKVTQFTSNQIRFEASDGGRKIRKTYTLPDVKKGPYCFDFELQIDGDASGLWLSSGVPDVELVGGSYTPQLKYQITSKGGSDVEEIKLPKEVSQENSVAPNWISNCNGFLGLILDPLHSVTAGFQVERIDGAALPTRLSLIDAAYHLYPSSNYPGYLTELPLKSGTTNFRIFAGPYDEALLKQLDELYANPEANYNPEYNLAISIQGWFSFISQPFSKFLFFLMQIFYYLTRSWAVSIVLLTIALRVMMYPLNSWSIRSTAKMQEIAPRIKIVQERHKKDPRKAQLEVMALYKEAGVNPFSGCLPMLLQMPFLIGMFYMLKSSFPLRGAPFIPGWIDDLAAPDVLFSWGQPIWLIGNEFHLLPILTGLVMYLHGKMTQKMPKDESQLTDAQRQQKTMGIFMSVIFTFMFYSFPSGLNIYFMFSTLLGLLQQQWTMKRLKVTPV
ncbi:MAG: membrane protein insertase YidC [Verrucomicrobiota bacterium]|nr:membrane protein insertase YidC [Verrucomicrobiota bacterium]